MPQSHSRACLDEWVKLVTCRLLWVYIHVLLVTPVLVLEYEVVGKYAVFACRHLIRGIIEYKLCEYTFCPKNNERLCLMFICIT